MRSASSTYASLAGAGGALAWASGALMPASLLLPSRANRGFVLGERARELVAKLVRDGDVRIRRVLVDRVELRLHYVIVLGEGLRRAARGRRARELVAKLVRDGDVRIRRVLVDRVELRLHYVIVLGEGLRRAARAGRVLRHHRERRLAELDRGEPGLALEHLDAEIPQLEHVAHVVGTGDELQSGKVGARNARELSDGIAIIERDDQKVGARRARRMQQIEPRRVAVEHPKAELAGLLDVIGIVVEHGRLVAARVQQPRHYLADTAETRDDDLARLRQVRLPHLRGGGKRGGGTGGGPQ